MHIGIQVVRHFRKILSEIAARPALVTNGYVSGSLMVVTITFAVRVIGNTIFFEHCHFELLGNSVQEEKPVV